MFGDTEFHTIVPQQAPATTNPLPTSHQDGYRCLFLIFRHSIILKIDCFKMKSELNVNGPYGRDEGGKINFGFILSMLRIIS